MMAARPWVTSQRSARDRLISSAGGGTTQGGRPEADQTDAFVTMDKATILRRRERLADLGVRVCTPSEALVLLR